MGPDQVLLRLILTSSAVALACSQSATSQATIAWVESTDGVVLAVDPSDNVYTARYDMNPAGDITLTKRASNGQFLWSTSYDNADPTRFESVSWLECDSQGNVFVVGGIHSGFSNPVNVNSLLMKFDADGGLLWRVVYETDFDGTRTVMAVVDELDHIYVLGTGFGPVGLVSKVQKFTPEGATVWSYFDPVGIGFPVRLKFAADGDLLISAASLFGSINGYARIDREGNGLWSLTGVQSLTLGDVAGDSLGNSYIVHRENAIGGGTQMKKLLPDGTIAWDRRYGGLVAQRVEIGPDELPVACGFPALGAGAAFLKVDAAGEVVWSNLDADGPLSLLLHARLLVDAFGSAYLAAGTLFEMAVCKVDADGASAWTATMPGGYAQGMGFGSDLDLYVVGGTTARIDQVVEGRADSRNGRGANRACWTSSNTPLIGSTWSASIDTTSHSGAVLSLFAGFSAALDPGLVLPWGELLVDPSSFLLVQRSVVSSGATDSFDVFVPQDVALVGVFVSTQGAITGGGVELCNALDLRIGG